MKRACIITAFLAVAAASGPGCMNRELVRVDPNTRSFVVDALPVQSPAVVDILVVVDNSGSMAAEQAMLRDAFPNLIRSILTGKDDTGAQVHEPVRDLHIGVISNDMGVGGYSVVTCEENPLSGDDGILRHTPRAAGCAVSYPTFLDYKIDATAEPDLAQVDQLAADFGCIAVLGTDGCGFEQQLKAAYQALVTHSVPGGANAGFLREESILTILFVTDEEDCSAEDMTLFDTSTYTYSINLGCYYQADKLQSIDFYFNAFKGLRGNPSSHEVPEDLVIGFIVGVPPGDPACNGRGDEIGTCNDQPAMQETVRGDNELLEYVCTYPADCTPPDPPSAGNCIAEAFPARRFVELAQAFGDNAVVQSICTDSFVPAVKALTEKLREAFTSKAVIRQLEVEKDPDNTCRCIASCTIIEELDDPSACPDEDGDTVPNIYDADHDGIGDLRTDDTGLQHSLCEIPQAGSIIDNCDLACDDPKATHTKDPSHAGWWYNPYGPTGVDENGDDMIDIGPVVDFSDAMPQPGSSVSIQCASEVCPTERQCGASPSYNSKCCNINEYCLYEDPSKVADGYCLLRQDVCREYGNDVWCPGAGPPSVVESAGGICCLDADQNGNLEWVLEDVNGDGVGDLPDYPLNACAGNTCQPR
jgi:hypothetical protein